MPRWDEVLKEIVEAENQAQQALHIVKQKYLEKLKNYTNRNIIAYYSGFLSKPNISGSEINDEDKNGFMMAIQGMDRTKGLDLILHTPGGGIAATESIAHYLHEMFGNDIRAIIPQISMSAGTMLACCCKEIIMGKQSNLGPTDPHLSNLPALGVLEEFKKAEEQIIANPAMVNVWGPILSKYHPTFLGQCQKAKDWTKDFLTKQLEKNMFCEETDPKAKVERIVNLLMDTSTNKAHDRHIHAPTLIEHGLKVTMLEGDQELQDLVLTLHHAYMNALMNTSAFKFIENDRGIAFVKHSHNEQKM